MRGSQAVQKGVGQLVDCGRGQQEFPSNLQLLSDFLILPVITETRQTDGDNQVKCVVSLGRHQLMVGFRVMNLAAADTLLLDVTYPRLTEHHSQRVAGRTALTIQRSPAGFTNRLLAGHFEKVVLGQLPQGRQRPRPCAQQLGADLQKLDSPFFTDS